MAKDKVKIERVENDNEKLFSDPQAMLDYLQSLIIPYCEKWHFNPDDMRPANFNAVLDYLYYSFFKPNKYMYILNSIHDPNCINNATNTVNNKYNFDVVLYIYNIYKTLCNMYSQVINIDGFCYISGINESTIARWKDGLDTGATPEQCQFFKRIHEDKQKSLENMLMDKSINPIKPIAILNHRYGWNMPGVTREVRETPALSVEQLPKLTAPDVQKPILTGESE